jgi:hypothetical protein
MSDPVGDAEGAEFGEVAVVEDQDEVTSSSRIAPGSRRIETPAIPLEIGSCATVASLP